MAVIIGSARIDENGKAHGGAAGDQKQTSSINDTVGEVSMQNFYVHSKGWYILRPKDAAIANKIAANMKTACDNANIGYDQYQRSGVITNGINTKTPTESDCSSLVRECVKEASGKDPGNFTTENEVDVLEATGLFESKITYTSGTTLYTGDILVTKTKGHTAIVVSGAARTTTSSSTTTTSTSTTKKTATDAAKSKDSSLAGTYKTTANLNMRNGAGTSKSIMVTLPKGTSVKNYGYYTEVSGTKWLYVQVTYNNVVYTGFCSGKYLSKQ